MKVFVWGAGRCGRSLALALWDAERRGVAVTVAGTWNRTEVAAQRAGAAPYPTFFGDALPDALHTADVVWLTVPDADVAAVARAVLLPHHVALHASGAVPARTLRVDSTRPRAVAACHPIQSFAAPVSSPAHVAAATFGIEGEPEATATARALVDAMGARAFEVHDDASKALYHAACCVASNAFVALVDRAVSLFAAAGVSRADALHALHPLIAGTVANLATTDDARKVLTGPIQRGQVDVVRAHLAAIDARVPEEHAAYALFAREILRIVPESAASKAIAALVGE